MPSAIAKQSALPTNTDGPLFTRQGFPIETPDTDNVPTAIDGPFAGFPSAPTPDTDDAAADDDVGTVAGAALDAVDAAAGTTKSIVNNLKRFNELLDKLTKSPENAGTDFRHLISIVENTLLTEKLNAEEMAELKALYKKIQGALGADPGLDTVINSALKRYKTSFPTSAAVTTTGSDPEPANNGGDGNNSSSTNNGITVQIPDNMRKELGLNEKTPKYAQLKLSPNGKVIYIRHDAAGKSSGPTIMFNSKEGKKIQKIVAAAGAKFIGGPATSAAATKKPNEVLATQAHVDAMKKAGMTDYPMVGEVLTAADIKILQRLMGPKTPRADQPPAAVTSPAAKPPAAKPPAAKPPKGLAPPSQLPTNPTVSGNAAQRYINRTKQESLANDIINMMNEATFDTSTSLWRASGGGKRKLPAVKQMQQWLNNNGFDAGKADGWYGKGTARAVKAMQQAYGLSADGDAGPNTLSAMNKASPEPVDQDAEIAAMAAQTKGDLDQDDSVGAVGAAGAAAGSIKGGKAPAGVAAGVASGAAAGDPEPDQTVTTTAPVDSTDAGIDAATDNVNKSMAAGNVTGVQSDAEKAAADLKAKQDASSAAAQAQFQKTKGDVSDKLGGAPDQTITTTGGAAANAGTAGNRGGVDTAIAAKTAELNRAAKQRKAEQLRRQQERAALQRRKSASSSVQGRDDNVNTGAGVGTNSGNWKPKAGTVVRQSMYKESGIKFSGSIANAIAKLGKKR